MKDETQAKYWQWKKAEERNSVEKKAFSAYLQHISGNKWLLHKLIELPLVVVDRVGDSSEDSPSRAVEQTGGFCTKSTLRHLIQRWKEHKNSHEYQEFLRKSSRKAEGQKRLRLRIREVQKRHQEGARLSLELEQGCKRWEWLTSSQTTSVQEYEQGQSALEYRKLLDEHLDGIKYYGGNYRMC